AATPGSWQWPVNGTVTREYDANKVFKGINIHSSPGTPVKAAGAGTVVYAGSGLRGYGQLIILKHDDTYLSAYAHNSKILVSENDSVSQGQTIAEVGGAIRRIRPACTSRFASTASPWIRSPCCPRCAEIAPDG